MIKTRVDPLGFITTFDTDTGLQIRGDKKDGSDPSFSSFPELVDLCITKACTENCEYCYMDADKWGAHAGKDDLHFIVTEMAKNEIFQVAIGGGEPLTHPHFIELIDACNDNGIVPNFSTARTIGPSYLNLLKGKIGAYAVSYHGQDFGKFVEPIRIAGENGFKVNIHFVLGADPEFKVKDVLNYFSDPSIFVNGKSPLNAAIFLRWKPVGRAVKEPPNNYYWLYEELKHMNRPFYLGIDSCLAPLVASEVPQVNPIYYDFCEGGRFSVYIDAVTMEVKVCSFDKRPGISLRNYSLKEAWDMLNKEQSPCKLSLF